MTNFTHSTARFAVWNLAGFNQPRPDEGVIADSDKAENQALGLALLDADFVTLVEVCPITHIDWLVDRLRDDYGVEYQSTILDQPNSVLNIGFLHKPGIDVSNPRFIPESNGTAASGRLAIAVDIEIGTKFDATVVGVHLKSGRQKESQDIRDSQCEVIGDWLTVIREERGRGNDLLALMGDFNMIPGQDVSNFAKLGGDDVMDFVSSWDLQDRYSHILKTGRENLLDGFAISRTFSRDYIPGTLRLFPMHWAMKLGQAAFRDRVSDHLPFVASFKVF